MFCSSRMPRERSAYCLCWSSNSYPTNLFCRESSQLSTKLDMSMVTVIGPTPPGTGVTLWQRWRHSSLNSTSPVISVSAVYCSGSLVSPGWTSTKFMPTSITIAPSLIQFDLIRPGTPHAAITISASSTVYLKSVSGVLEKQIVTKAFSLFNRRYIGIPTILLRPIKATFLPKSWSVD